MAWYSRLADLVAAIHQVYIGYVVVGLLLIFAGIVLRWQWIRNVWFRVSHLIMIMIVAGEAAFEIWCPLTRWESELRTLAGQKSREGTFIGELMEKVFIYYWPEWVFTTVYMAVALIVLFTFWLAPPRFKPREPMGEPEEAHALSTQIAALPSAL